MRFTFVFIVLAVAQSVTMAQSIDSLQQIVESEKRDTTYINSLAKLAQHYRGKDDVRSAFYMRRIMENPEIHPTRTARIYISYALIQSDQADYDSANHFFRKAKLITDSRPDEVTLRSAYHNGLGLLEKKKGNYQEALKNYKIVAELGEAKLGKENIAGNMLNIANVYGHLGNRRLAIRYLFDALKMFEKIGNEKGMSYCYTSLGTTLLQQEEFTQAKVYLLKSLAMKEKAGDKRGIANACNELGLVHMNLKDYPRAEHYVNRTLETSKALGLHELYITGLIHKAKVLRMQGRLEEASTSLNEARPLAEKLPNASVLSTLEAEVGKLYAEQRSNGEAIAQLITSAESASRANNIEAHLNSLLFLSEAYYKNHQYKEAYDVFQRYHVLEDSARGKALKLGYKELETKYGVEKKDAEIELLRKDKEIMIQTEKKQRAIQTVVAIGVVSIIIIAGLLINHYRVISRTKRLLELERVRNSIARDLHDDIGSAISSIQILSNVALQNNADQPNRNVHLEKIANQSGSIMERMSDIVWSIHPGNDSLHLVTSKMKEFTSEILEPKNIQYNFTGTHNGTDTVLGLEIKRNLFLMYKEILNNAAKYSGASLVSIEFSLAKETLILHVADNGRGFDVQTVRKGNGLTNINERSRAMNAACTINSTPGIGTSVRVSIPLT